MCTGEKLAEVTGKFLFARKTDTMAMRVPVTMTTTFVTTILAGVSYVFSRHWVPSTPEDFQGASGRLSSWVCVHLPPFPDCYKSFLT